MIVQRVTVSQARADPRLKLYLDFFKARKFLRVLHFKYEKNAWSVNHTTFPVLFIVEERKKQKENIIL
jgi:hypothetical protein